VDKRCLHKPAHLDVGGESGGGGVDDAEGHGNGSATAAAAPVR
jgi:hypothetical protein